MRWRSPPIGTSLTLYAERSRLASTNDDADVVYEIVGGTAHGVYPEDESPPWVDDPERLRKRGYEDRSIRPKT